VPVPAPVLGESGELQVPLLLANTPADPEGLETPGALRGQGADLPGTALIVHPAGERALRALSGDVDVAVRSAKAASAAKDRSQASIRSCARVFRDSSGTAARRGGDPVGIEPSFPVFVPLPLRPEGERAIVAPVRGTSECPWARWNSARAARESSHKRPRAPARRVSPDHSKPSRVKRSPAGD
jgi:hypothetical protein